MIDPDVDCNFSEIFKFEIFTKSCKLKMRKGVIKGVIISISLFSTSVLINLFVLQKYVTL